MFYSHEILTNGEHGVATIWLAATVGSGGSRKLSKKAIMDVNVRKACEKIIQPDAPIALRLQGSLLYGASYVYGRQCHYVLNDAEKVRVSMRAFFMKAMAQNEIEPEAGKVKRHQIMLEDDPDFDPLGPLPVFDFDLEGDRFTSSQDSPQQFSNFTPPNGDGSSSGRPRSILAFDLSQDFTGSNGNVELPSPFGAPDSSTRKPPPQPDPFDDELAPIGGFALDFDADGNLVEIMEPEPELPRLQMSEDELSSPTRQTQGRIQQPIEENGNILMMSDEVLPDAEAFPTGAVVKAPASNGEKLEEVESEKATVPAGSKGRVRKPLQFVDQDTMVPKKVMKTWDREYEQKCGLGGKKTRHNVTAGQARMNAFQLTYGFGIFGIGQPTPLAGISHPLAEYFAGDGLRVALAQKTKVQAPQFRRGRRRSSEEAFEDEDEERRVRPRLEEDGQQMGRGVEGRGFPMPPGDDSMPEMGMEAQPPLGEHHTSLLMPWNRSGSVVPGSSIRGSAQKLQSSRHVSASPLVGRGSMIQDIERFSDAASGQAFGSDQFAPLHSQVSVSSFNELGIQADTPYSPKQEESLETGGKDFLTYTVEMAQKHGFTRAWDSQTNRRWIEFEDLADPEKHSKAVATAAFMHVLSLATRNLVRVKQREPFTTIHISIEADEVEELGTEAVE